MSNSEKYFFSDFIIEHYIELLREAQLHYKVRNFINFDKMENFVIFRHDVDFSMLEAKKMAQIEAKEGVQSTYLLLFHSEFYNLLEKENAKIVKDIMDLGHEVGLHFDSHFYDCRNLQSLEENLMFEKRMLEKLFGKTIDAFSFHITNPYTLSCDSEMYSGMVNAFSKYFQKEVGYCSDSNGYWRHDRMMDKILSGSGSLQLLTHPVWWSEKIMSPKERLWRSVESQGDKCKLWYDSLLRNNGRINIDW